MKTPDPVRDATKANDKLPRGHAYIRMRNRGCAFHIDYEEVDSAEAERMMKAVLEILNTSGAGVGEGS